MPSCWLLLEDVLAPPILDRSWTLPKVLQDTVVLIQLKEFNASRLLCIYSIFYFSCELRKF